ncbi:MAG: sulfatase-like hydrolase/transferase, partial [Sphingopyxis sp.]
TGERPPNVILILADDLGINDITTFGGGIAGGAVPTPNIDALAAEGVQFSTAYAANATCSPSRAALMTGRYPTRFGQEFTAVPVQFAQVMAEGEGSGGHRAIYHESDNIVDYPMMGMPQSEVTIAELLRGRGYHTMHIGKWHLGEAVELSPHAQGFDESLQMMGGASIYMPDGDPNLADAPLPFFPNDAFIRVNTRHAVKWNSGPRFAPVGHMTDYFTDQAMAALEANRTRPFFLYLAYTAPHNPIQALRADYDALPQIADHTTRVYGAMIRQLDRRIGDLMARLDALGMAENTLVIFTSDNGGASYDGIPDLNLPYRGWKATFFEGGIRAPLFMRWPARIAAGTRRSDVTGHLDVFATIAAAAGAAVPSDRIIDSRNILNGPAQREAIYWRSGAYRAMRQGDWKLQVTARPARVRLYNLANDPTERHDLSAAEPARVAAMRSMLEAHNRDMAPPIWPSRIEMPVRIDVPINAPTRSGEDYIYWAN